MAGAWPTLEVSVPAEGGARMLACETIARRLCAPTIGESDLDVAATELSGGTTNAIVYVRVAHRVPVGSECERNGDDAAHAPHYPSVEAVIRVYGQGTGTLIDRAQELVNIDRIHRAGMGPPILGVFGNGFCVGYQPGTTLTREDMSDPAMCRRIAVSLASWHRNVIPDKGSTPCLIQTLYKWLDAVPTVFDDDTVQAKFASKINMNEIRKRVEHVEACVNAEVNVTVGHGHNDLLCKNILYDDRQDKCCFIDFEYGFTNYTTFDIANHWCEFAGMDDIDFSLCPNLAFKRKWLAMYLAAMDGIDEADVASARIDETLRHCNIMTLAAHLFWGIWALNQAACSTIAYDYMEFASMRFQQYTVDFEASNS